MNRRDLLKGLTVLPSVTLGSLIIGNTEKGISVAVTASEMTRGKYVLFADPGHVDIGQMNGALLPPGFKEIECIIVPVITAGRPISEVLKMYKVDK